MKKLQINVEQAVAITSSANEVTVPNFVVQGSIHIKESGLAIHAEGVQSVLSVTCSSPRLT